MDVSEAENGETKKKKKKSTADENDLTETKKKKKKQAVTEQNGTAETVTASPKKTKTKTEKTDTEKENDEDDDGVPPEHAAGRFSNFPIREKTIAKLKGKPYVLRLAVSNIQANVQCESKLDKGCGATYC